MADKGLRLLRAIGVCLLCGLLFLPAPLGAADLYQRGVEALKAGKLKPARRALEQVVKAEPDRAEAWWELGWVYWRQGKIEKAKQAWEQVKRLTPERPELKHWLTAVRTKLALRDLELQKALVPQNPSEKRITFAAAGDTMMGTALRKGPTGLAPGDGQSLFAHVKDLFAAADVAFLNLEGPLADDLPQTKCRPDSVSCYAFRTPTRYVAALESASIDVVSCANNHAMDVGVAGMNATLDTLDGAGIRHAGRYGDTALLDVRGTRVAFVAAHSGSCCVNVNRVSEVFAAVQQAKAKADLVVLSMHAGAEGARHRHVPGKAERAYGEWRGDVKNLARAAIDAGADLVLGHGPHVLRAMEVYRGRLIVYSLGNFMGYKQFGLRGGFGGTTVILQAELADNGVLVSARLHPIAMDSNSVPRPDPKGLGLQHVRELSKQDFPRTGVRVAKDGSLDWSGRPKP